MYVVRIVRKAVLVGLAWGVIGGVIALIALAFGNACADNIVKNGGEPLVCGLMIFSVYIPADFMAQLLNSNSSSASSLYWTASIGWFAILFVVGTVANLLPQRFRNIKISGRVIGRALILSLIGFIVLIFISPSTPVPLLACGGIIVGFVISFIWYLWQFIRSRQR